jgi:hypothetical protein
VFFRSSSEADPAGYGYWGYIAEEVAEIDPRLVHYAFQEDQIETVEIEPGVFEQRPKVGEVKRPDGVQYDRIPVLQVAALKRRSEEQQAKIGSLEEQIAAANSKIESLEGRLMAAGF